MEYQALYRAWRPRTFADMIGQEAVTRTLRHQVMTGHVAHAYLFSGTRGTGKTTAARVLARAINCQSPVDGDPCGTCDACRALAQDNAVDIVEIDAASNNGVDDVRAILERVNYLPALVKYKVYIIDEVHMLSAGAFNALLKTLEEPPRHVVFILATTEPRKLPATILSRCQRFDFHRFTVAEVSGRLRTVLSGIGREAEEGALAEIARASEGTMRDALNLLDVCLSYTDGIVTEQLAVEVMGATSRALTRDFVRAVVAFDAASALGKIDEVMRAGGDPQLFARDAADYYRGLLLSRHVKDAAGILDLPPEDAAEMATIASSAEETQLLRQMDLFLRVESDMKLASSPRTMLELAAARACHPEREPDADASERIHKLELAMERGVAPKPAAAPAPPAARRPAPARTSSAPGTPAATPPAEYDAAIQRLSAENPSLARSLSVMKFLSMEGDVVSVSFDSKAVLLRGMLERKQELLTDAFSTAFGRPIQLRMTGETRAEKSSPDQSYRSTLSQAYDVFSREDLEITE